MMSFNGNFLGTPTWAMQGLEVLKQQGGRLFLPDIIKLASEEYFQESDVLGPFLEERCELRATNSILRSELYQAYQDWCEKNDELPMNNRGFNDQLVDRKLTKRDTAKERLWVGIGLKTHVQEDEDLELAPNA